MPEGFRDIFPVLARILILEICDFMLSYSYQIEKGRIFRWQK